MEKHPLGIEENEFLELYEQTFGSLFSKADDVRTRLLDQYYPYLKLTSTPRGTRYFYPHPPF